MAKMQSISNAKPTALRRSPFAAVGGLPEREFPNADHQTRNRFSAAAR